MSFSDTCTGVWATRADYLPRTLEPRAVDSLLLPRQQDGCPHNDASTRDLLSMETVAGERGGCGVTELDDRTLDGEGTTVQEKSKEEIEREVREALFRGGLRSPSVSKKKPKSYEYKGRPLQGAWATAGQTGALVVGKPEEPHTPVRFGIGSPGSSVADSGSTTPLRSGTQTPNHKVDQTPPRQLQTPNWSTPQNDRYHRRYQHSRSGPEMGFSPSTPQRTATRRYNSEQSPSDQLHHQKRSHDRDDQSHVNNWNIHVPRDPDRHGNSDSRGSGYHRNSDRSGPDHRGNSDRKGRGTRGRGRGRGRGQDGRTNWQERPYKSQPHTDREREGGRYGQKDSSPYQRSQSDVTGRPLTRGASPSSARKPYSETSLREQQRT